MGAMCCFRTCTALGGRNYILKGVAYQPPKYTSKETPPLISGYQILDSQTLLDLEDRGVLEKAESIDNAAK